MNSTDVIVVNDTDLTGYSDYDALLNCINLNISRYYRVPVRNNISETNSLIVYIERVDYNSILIKDKCDKYIDLAWKNGKFMRKTPDGQILLFLDDPKYSKTIVNGKEFIWNSYCSIKDFEKTKVVNQELIATPTTKSQMAVLASRMIEEIADKEEDAAKAIYMAIQHIHGTYKDKYAKGQDVIDTKKMLYDKDRGDFLNIYQVNRYLQRYLTVGSPKSHLIKDIEKAVHYLIFELTRRIKMGDAKEIEPKI